MSSFVSENSQLDHGPTYWPSRGRIVSPVELGLFLLILDCSCSHNHGPGGGAVCSSHTSLGSFCFPSWWPFRAPMSGSPWRCKLAMPSVCGGGCCLPVRPSLWLSLSGQCISSACWPLVSRFLSTTSCFRRFCRSWFACLWSALRCSLSAAAHSPSLA